MSRLRHEIQLFFDFYDLFNFLDIFKQQIFKMFHGLVFIYLTRLMNDTVSFADRHNANQSLVAHLFLATITMSVSLLFSISSNTGSGNAHRCTCLNV